MNFARRRWSSKPRQLGTSTTAASTSSSHPIEVQNYTSFPAYDGVENFASEDEAMPTSPPVLPLQLNEHSHDGDSIKNERLRSGVTVADMEAYERRRRLKIQATHRRTRLKHSIAIISLITVAGFLLYRLNLLAYFTNSLTSQGLSICYQRDFQDDLDFNDTIETYFRELSDIIEPSRVLTLLSKILAHKGDIPLYPSGVIDEKQFRTAYPTLGSISLKKRLSQALVQMEREFYADLDRVSDILGDAAMQCKMVCDDYIRLYDLIQKTANAAESTSPKRIILIITENFKKCNESSENARKIVSSLSQKFVDFNDLITQLITDQRAKVNHGDPDREAGELQSKLTERQSEFTELNAELRKVELDLAKHAESAAMANDKYLALKANYVADGTFDKSFWLKLYKDQVAASKAQNALKALLASIDDDKLKIERLSDQSDSINGRLQAASKQILLLQVQLGVIGTLNATVFSLEKLAQSLKSAESNMRYYEQGAKLVASKLHTIDSQRVTIDEAPDAELIAAYLPLICNKGYRISYMMYAQSGTARQHITAMKRVHEKTAHMNGDQALIELLEGKTPVSIDAAGQRDNFFGNMTQELNSKRTESTSMLSNLLRSETWAKAFNAFDRFSAIVYRLRAFVPI